ncbi:hypothetical protein D3C73_1645800 [compost metagenome]
MPITPSHAATLAPVRNPIRNPTAKMIASVMMFATRDVITCAHSTLDRAIGMEWNRSKMPDCMSVKRRNAV